MNASELRELHGQTVGCLTPVLTPLPANADEHTAESSTLPYREPTTCFVARFAAPLAMLGFARRGSTPLMLR